MRLQRAWDLNVPKRSEGRREEEKKKIMNTANEKKKLPQEGTSAACGTGESLTGALDMSTAITRAPVRPSYSGGGQNSHTSNTPMEGGAASQYRSPIVNAAAHNARTTESEDAGGNKTYFGGVNSTPISDTSVDDPFSRRGAVQRSPPTKGTDQENYVSTVISETQETNRALLTAARERKSSLGSIEKYFKVVDHPAKEADTGIFVRPFDKTNEEMCVSARESEAETSDCSLASSASTASLTRKRRQPYICKPGKAKKTAVRGEEIPDPYMCGAVTKAKIDLPTVDSIQENLKDCTSGDIVARILDSMSSIEKLADGSRNLRGAHVQSIRISARSALAAASELAYRSSIMDVEGLKKENCELRSELANLKSEMCMLTVEVNRLRQGDIPAKQAGESKMDKDSLVRRISALMDEKLVDFRTEILSKRTVQPTHEKKSENTSDTVHTKQKKNKAKKNSLKESSEATQTESSETTTVPVYSEGEHLTPPWATVVGRKTKAPSKPKGTDADVILRKKIVKTPSAPKTAAVSITLTESATVDYAAAMAIAKQRIKLADCGISQVRQKKALTGGLVLEVPGPDSAKKADALAERLRVALTDMGVRIARPCKTGELRIMDLDDSITKQDIAQAIAEAGECLQEDVKVGEIRYSKSKLGTVWVRGPLTTIKKLAVEKHLRVGWVRARVRVLAARQLQCFRCLELGHVRKQCASPVDRSLCCYSCGEQGHKARECEAKAPKCPVCADLGQPADHRLGGPKCNPPKKKRTLGQPLESREESKTAQWASQPPVRATETQNIKS